VAYRFSPEVEEATAAKPRDDQSIDSSQSSSLPNLF
jgi:hypothetical protein